MSEGPYRTSAMPRPSYPEERYQRDPHYRCLVDVLEQAIHAAQYTPTEIREAAMLAAIRYEMRRGMPALRFYVEPVDPARERMAIPMSAGDMARLVEQLSRPLDGRTGGE